MRTRKKKGFWQSNANKKNFLLDLTKKLNIKEEDLKQLKWKDIKNEGGSGLIQVSKNLSNIFSLLSPTPFSNFNKRKPIGYWSLIENHYKHLEEVYCKYNFQSLEDWKKPLKEIKKIINCSLLLHYKHNFKKILIKLYPNYPWNFIMKKEKGYWEDIQNQRLFLESLFSSLKLNNLNQLNNIELIEKNGGRLLIKKYKYNTKLLLKTIFPDYKEEISDNILKRNKRGYWNSIDNQSLFMKHLFDDLNLKSEEEWGMMTWKDIMKKKGGSNLHRIYSGNLHKLFQSIFPTLSYSYHSTKSKLRLKLIKLQNEYQIRKKIDWYRIPSPNLISCLNFFHPDEKWHKIDFAIRRKKSSQRSLFISIYHHFPNHILLEDYFHPYLLSPITQKCLEIDVFLPAFNYGFEYQGLQHYDEVPGGFNPLELYRIKDLEKLELAQSKLISLFYVPYWWNKSLPLPFSM